MMRRTCLILSLFSSLLVWTGESAAQSPSADSPEPDDAVVYVYRFDEDMVVSNLFFWFIKARPIYFGDPPKPKAKPVYRKIAALRNKEYFVMRLPPKKYIFKTRSMWGRLEVDLEAGREYHLWVDQGKDCPTEENPAWLPPSCEGRTASIAEISPERWEEHRGDLKPIRAKQVKDRSLITIPTGPPN